MGEGLALQFSRLPTRNETSEPRAFKKCSAEKTGSHKRRPVLRPLFSVTYYSGPAHSAWGAARLCMDASHQCHKGTGQEQSATCVHKVYVRVEHNTLSIHNHRHAHAPS